MRLELEALQDAMQLLNVLGIFGTDEKVKVDEAGLGGDATGHPNRSQIPRS